MRTITVNDEVLAKSFDNDPVGFLWTGYVKLLLNVYDHAAWRGRHIAQGRIAQSSFPANLLAKPALINRMIKDHLGRQFAVLGEGDAIDLTVEDYENAMFLAWELKYHREWSNRYPRNGILCYSGGMDSEITLSLLGEKKEPLKVHVDYGGPYSDKERALVEAGADTILSFPTDLRIDPDRLVEGYIIPGRNGFIALASLYLSCHENHNMADRVYMTSHYRSDEGQLVGAVDKNLRFFEELTSIIRLTRSTWEGETFELTSLTSHMSKGESLQLAYSIANDKEVFLEKMAATTSCYHPTHNRCGECSACFKRFLAVKESGIPYTEEYTVHPEVSQFHQAHQKREQNKGR